MDESGVSGTGRVAQGVEFDDGTVALRWLTETASTAVYDSIGDVVTIHGHAGATVIAFESGDSIELGAPRPDLLVGLEDQIRTAGPNDSGTIEEIVGRLWEESRGRTIFTLGGIPVVLDRSVPPDHVDFRSPDGRRVRFAL